jgi:hypothetical protein
MNRQLSRRPRYHFFVFSNQAAETAMSTAKITAILRHDEVAAGRELAGSTE